MRLLHLLLPALIPLVLALRPADPPPPVHMSAPEHAMLQAIDRMRTDPKAYLERVQHEYARLLTDSAHWAGRRSEVVTTRWVMEGDAVVKQVDTTYGNPYADRVRAFQDLMDDLARTAPLPRLTPLTALYEVAVAHGRDQTPHGYIEHWNSLGQWPQERIAQALPWGGEGNENIAAGPDDAEAILMQLMVDPGVEGYGHRRNLLDPRWRFIACHRVDALSGEGRAWWIQEFAMGPNVP